MLNRNISLFALFTVFLLIASDSAYAISAADISVGILESTKTLPALMSGFSYLSGVLLCVLGILKTLDHVTNPNQTPIRQPVVRFFVGGGLFALPIIMQAAFETIFGAGATGSLQPFAVASTINSVMGTSAGSSVGFNNMLLGAVNTMEFLPDLVSGVAYLLGILMIISALFKIRDHVDDPARSSLKDPVIRLLVAGGLFGLPVIFEAMYVTMIGDGLGLNATIVNWALANGGPGFWLSNLDGTAGTVCNGGTLNNTGTADTIGDMICLAIENSTIMPALLTGISYLFGLILGVWSLIKIRDHVTNPAQTSLWEGISRLLAGGAFFAMPAMAYAISKSFTPDGINKSSDLTSGFQENITCGTANSLDMAMACLMQDVLGPTHAMVNFFCFCAGLIFIMIGTSRIIKSAQDGAKGPGGAGTIGTFIVGGLLISATTILAAMSQSLFDTTTTTTLASLSYTSGMSTAETDAAYNVISAVMKFLIVIGLISFVRGIFIMRDVAEGSQQASTMAGMTHIIGGALAVNMGPLLNFLQTTLGITAFGVTFT